MKRTKVISITSGKGGVGKTTVVANLAHHLAKEGKTVLILDGDFGMANIDIMFNVKATQSIYDVVAGRAEIKDILVQATDKITVIPGGSGIFELQSLNSIQKQSLLDQIGMLSGQYDIMLVDTAPGIADNVLYLNAAANETMVVVTPDPASLTDSYALIKVLNQRYRENRFSVICNQVKDEQDGVKIFNHLDGVCARFLNVRLDYAGSIPNDLILRQCTRNRQIVSQVNSEAISALSMRKLASGMSGQSPSPELKGGMQFFWRQLVGLV
jgi:flagellar biosynthesis protein FlhG